MARNDKKPEIRFNGFNGVWEQRMLGDEALEIVAGGDVDKNKISNKGKYPVLANALTDDGIIGFYQDEFRIKAPAVTVTGRGDVGHAKARKIDFTPVVRLLSIKSNHDIDFLENAINNHKVLVESTGVPQLTVPQLAKYEINFPNDINEEKRIGAFFLKFNNLIALHQRKYDKLIIHKKSMFEKMFPKDGVDVPEVRFAGYTDNWKKCKLGEIVDRVQGNDGRMDLPTLTISAANGWLDQRDRFYGNIAGNEQKNYTLLSKGELSYNHGNSKLAKYGVVFELENYEEALVPRVYHSFRVKEDTVSSFVEYIFSTKLPDKELGKLISSGARMDGLLNISYDDFMSITIKTPQKAEQAKIGAYFRKLDHLITLHQREVEKLKKIKKSMLEKMFV